MEKKSTQQAGFLFLKESPTMEEPLIHRPSTSAQYLADVLNKPESSKKIPCKRVPFFFSFKFKDDVSPEKVNVELLREKHEGPGCLPQHHVPREVSLEKEARPSPLDPAS